MRKLLLAALVASLLLPGSIYAAQGDFWTGGYDRTNSRDDWRINSGHHLIPGGDDAYDIGTSTAEVRNLYVDGTAYIDAFDTISAATITTLTTTTLQATSSNSTATATTGNAYAFDVRTLTGGYGIYILREDATMNTFGRAIVIYDPAEKILWGVDDAGLTTAAGGFTGTGATTYDAGGAAAITIGSADVTSVTVTVDGTGTGEFVLPAGAIDAAEQTNAGKTFVVTLMIPDVSTADTIYAAMPKCTLISVITALETTITSADAAVNLYKNDLTITGSPVTVAYSGSLPGDFDSATPSANNTFNGTSDVFWLGNIGASDTASNLTVSLICTSTD